MTDETKTLFNAPWRVEKPVFGLDYEIRDNKNTVLAVTSVREIAKSVARFPDLYDALADAVREHCCDCIDQVYDNPGTYDPVEKGCLFKKEHCCEKCRSWIALLNKVREGK